MDPTERFLDDSRFWVQRVFVPLLVLVGVGGNVVTVIVLTRRGMRCSTNVYLTALAVVDVVYLLFVLLLSFEHYPNIHDLRFELYWRFYGINRWLVDAASSSSVWLTVSFTVERYIAVCHPIRGKVMCTERRAKRVITGVVVLCLLATATTSFEYQLAILPAPCGPGVARCGLSANVTYIANVSEPTLRLSELNNGSNASVSADLAYAYNLTECCTSVYEIWTELTALGTNPTYTTLFYWFTCVTFTFLPLVLLATLNCVLVNAVRRSSHHRRRLTKSRETGAQHQENRMTVILISVVLLFLICQTPMAGLLIYTSVYPSGRLLHQDRLLRVLGNVFNMLVNINAACNFLLYCALSSKYRRTFRTIFCGPEVRIVPPVSVYRNGTRGGTSTRVTSLSPLSVRSATSCGSVGSASRASTAPPVAVAATR